MCDGRISVRVNVWRHFRTSESVMWTSPLLARGIKSFDMSVCFVRYPILVRYACSWMQRFSTSCKFNKHRNRRNYEYVYGRRIIFGLCKCFSHMQFMGRTKKILQSWKGICCIFFASWFWKRRYSANLTSFWHSNKWESSENKLSLGPSRVCTRKILHSREQEKLPPSLINVGFAHLT